MMLTGNPGGPVRWVLAKSADYIVGNEIGQDCGMITTPTRRSGLGPHGFWYLHDCHR